METAQIRIFLFLMQQKFMQLNTFLGVLFSDYLISYKPYASDNLQACLWSS